MLAIRTPQGRNAWASGGHVEFKRGRSALDAPAVRRKVRRIPSWDRAIASARWRLAGQLERLSNREPWKWCAVVGRLAPNSCWRHTAPGLHYTEADTGRSRLSKGYQILRKRAVTVGRSHPGVGVDRGTQGNAVANGHGRPSPVESARIRGPRLRAPTKQSAAI